MIAVRKSWVLVAVVSPLAIGALWLAGPLIPLGSVVRGRGPIDRSAVALTFDDGPNPLTTPRVIDVLDRYHAGGTFFLVGANVERHPEVASLITRRGYEVGNHSEFHANLLPYYLPQQIAADYRRAEDAIARATGTAPRLYRAPHGRISPWMRLTLRQAGMVLIGWDYSPRDWEHPGTDELVKRVTGAVRNGSIILLHDGLDLNDSPDNSQLVDALPRIIEDLQGRGFMLVSVSELLGERPYVKP